MSKFINPFSDFGFKKIFGSEVSKDLIISFLNGVLHEEVIVNITFRNVELLGMKQEQGKVVFDIFCENEKGEIFVVEMLKSPSEVLFRPYPLLRFVRYPATNDDCP